MSKNVIPESEFPRILKLFHESLYSEQNKEGASITITAENIEREQTRYISGIKLCEEFAANEKKEPVYPSISFVKDGHGGIKYQELSCS